MCLFCKIASHEVQSRSVFENEEIMAFHDIAPQAPVHILVIPKRHISSLDAALPDDEGLLGRLLLAAQRVARLSGLQHDGFRVVINTGALAGQSVFHIHVHVLGGRSLGWPPG